MSTADDSLLCPITLELFRDPVLAQDGHTYEREAILGWIQRNGRSPLTNQQLTTEHLYPNHAIKKAVDHFEKSLEKKRYQYILDIDVKKKVGRALFQTFGKTIFHADWLPVNDDRPEIVILKIDGARAQKEASFYVDLSRHPHIVRTYGFVHRDTDDDDDENNAVMLLQEYAPMGSLYDLLKERKKAPDEKILIEMFLQIIDAMNFLALNNVVHGDLACRNVLVFRFDENNPRNNVVKITDFGLSRHSKLYSLTPGAGRTTLNIVPTRYVAPELLSASVTKDDYTEKSDIYSMGVLMWEAYFRGAMPWAKINDDNDVVRRVVSGDLLPKPSNCSEQYWSILCQTWLKPPKDRPTFAELKHLLTEHCYPISAALSQIGKFSIAVPSGCGVNGFENKEGSAHALTRYLYAPQDSRGKTSGIYLPDEPDFSNRAKEPYKPINRSQIHANIKVLRDIEAILNKITPETYEKFQKQLEALEVDRYERLEGMIAILFSKAINEAAFRSLCARLCKQLQKKQVTVSNEKGEPKTYYFRQILLTRCQKEFENDYRREIKYEERKAEIAEIVDEKKRRDKAKKLEDDLAKAQQRKLGNILFLGELFQVRMLTDTIIYDCIEYLLRDKTDEVSLDGLCGLLRMIGKELDGRASEKAVTKNNLERHYRALDHIVNEQKVSARIRFMIRDLIELRQAAWVARRGEAKPITIHEMCKSVIIDTNSSGGNQQQDNDRRGTGIKTQNNRNDDDRVENRITVNSLRELQLHDKRGQGPLAMSLAPQRTWATGSVIPKKSEVDSSFTNRGGKPLAGPVQQLKGKFGSSQENASGYPLQHQSSRQTTSTSVGSNRSGNPSETFFDEEKTRACVHSLIEEYTENYSDSSDRPVKDALEDLAAFGKSNLKQQATIFRDLFVDVLEAKPRARKSVGHLLHAALNEGVLSPDAFLSGFKMLMDYTPHNVVDIPLVWQNIGEILGALIGASRSNLSILKPILQHVPTEKSKQVFHYVILYATEFSSPSHVQTLWHSSCFSLHDLLKSDLIDTSMENDYQWLMEGSKSENLSPHVDPQLVKLFNSSTDREIVASIQQHMDPTEKLYIRNIVLSYLEACLTNGDSQKKIRQDIAQQRMTVLNAIIQHKPEAEIQAVFAIQNFVNKLGHPPKMARVLFEIFYDEECISEDSFFNWLKQPDPREAEGHAVVEMSTKDFFTWLQQAETETEEEY